MNGDELSASEVEAYREIGEHWDTHSLADVWDQTREVKADVDIQSSRVCYVVESDLSRRLRALARRRGVSAETLLNLWVQEKLVQAVEAAPAAAE